MHRLSIVIPAATAQGPWEDTLASVLAFRPEGCEVIVAHAGSYDDPYDLRGEVRFLPAPSNGGVLGCLNVGTESAHSDTVHLLWPGVEVSEGWVDSALAAFDDDCLPEDCAMVAPLVTCQEEPERVLAVGVKYRASGARSVLPRQPRRLTAKRLNRLNVAAPTVLGGFYRREALLAVGALDASYGERLADVDLSLRMAAAGYRCQVAEDCRLTARAEIAAQEMGFGYGRGAEKLFLRSAPQAGWAKSLLLHPGAVLAEWVRNVHRPGGWTQLLGRVVGAMSFGSHRQGRQQIETLRQRTTVEATEPTIHALPEIGEIAETPLRKAA